MKTGMVGIVLAIIVSTSSLSFAAEVSFKKTQLVTVEKGRQRSVDVDLRIGDQTVMIVERRSGAVAATITRSKIDAMSYEISERHRIPNGAVLVLAAPYEPWALVGSVALVMTKTKSHWLTVRYRAGSEPQGIVLRLDKREYKGIISALNAGSGQKVTVLTGQESEIDPTRGSKNAQELLPFSASQVRAALKPAMEEYGCEIKEDKADEVMCKRPFDSYNELLGPGGERVTARLKAEGSSTRIQISTRKGLIGRWLKRNWSKPILQQTKKALGMPAASNQPAR
jgi:hypothetical protein